MTDDALNDYTYDAESRMTAGAGYTYTYDGLGRRVKKVGGMYERLYWYGASGEVLMESTPGGTKINEYIFFNGQRVATYRPQTTNWYYYFSDHLGSARVVTDDSGSVVEDSDYYPFGGEREVVSMLGNYYKFTGQERDPESGLDHFLFRDYSSRLACWTTPDPVPGDPADPQSLNRYTYVRNDPLNFKDPLGLGWCYGYHVYETPGYLDEDGRFIPTGPRRYVGFLPLACERYVNDLAGWRTLREYAEVLLNKGQVKKTSEEQEGVPCLQEALNRRFGGPFQHVSEISLPPRGGHLNAVFGASFSDKEFATFVNQLGPGVGPFGGLRFSDPDPLHIVPGDYTTVTPTSSGFDVQLQVHMDLVNPNRGDLAGVVGHAIADGLGGWVAQLLGGNIDPKCKQ